MATLTSQLEKFVKQSKWTFAKTYAAKWPHEYIVQERVDEDLFLALANYIESHGYESKFYKTPRMYLDDGGYTYWRIDNIINRCPEADTYHRRKQDGRLPANKS